MKPFRTTSIPEQLADHLRREVVEGRLEGMMPGVLRLERQTGVNRKTVEAALRILEADGLLETQGAGKRRRILLPERTRGGRFLRIAILLGESSDGKRDYMVHLQHLLTENGHAAFFAPSSLSKLGMNVERVARMVDQTAADAWVVNAGSRDVLEWFSAQSTPTLALFGRARKLRIACAALEKLPAYAEATRELIRLGHRRIVLLSRAQRRLPQPGAVEQAFLDELAAHGLPTSDYNLPDWEETIKGFQIRLESMFRVSPPTAMIVDEVPLFIATQQFLARNRLLVPDDVSLVCPDHDVAFDWCVPTVSHIRWDSGPVVRRIVRWANNVNRGRKDLRQTLTPAEFVPGGTIGRVRPDNHGAIDGLPAGGGR